MKIPRFMGLCLALGLASSACKKEPPPSEGADAPPEPAPAQKDALPGQADAQPGQADSSAPSAKAIVRPQEKLNVLFLTVDALRADMPWSGYDKPIAPHLTALAERAVVYEQHRSVSSYTAQTVATFLSGRYASTLYRTGMFFTNYSQENEWFTESLQRSGVRTLAVHAHLYFDRAPGLKQGFDVWQMVPGLSWNSETDESVTSPKSFEAITALLSDKKNTEGQFFLWAHLMDPHDKYVKHPESPDFGDKNRGRYDSEVWYVDHHLGKFFEFAEKQPWWSKTAFILSADHGESFGEHKMFKHAFELWEDLVRVPLVIVAPGITPRRIAAPRNHVDLAPTIMELMGKPLLDGFQGQSLVPELYGAEPPNREPILLELAEDTNNAHRQAIVSGTDKLIVFETGKVELYDLKADPGETRDLAPTQRDKAQALRALLDSEFAKLPRVQPYGGAKLKSGKSANGPKGPPKTANGP